MGDMADLQGMGMTNLPCPYPHDNRGPFLLRFTWSLISMSCVVVLARIWMKLSKARRMYADDICMAFALVFGLVHASLMSKGMENGLGRHMCHLTAHQRTETLRYGVFALGWGWSISPMMGRISFCITMLYVAGTNRRVNRWAKYGTATFIALQAVINILAFIVFYAQCGSNLNVLWHPEKLIADPDQCMNVRVQTELGYFQGAFNCLTDAYLTILPAILIEHTKLSIKKKIGLAVLLCLSIVALASAIGKTYEAKALSQVTDYSYDLALLVVWIDLELNIVIVASSVPLLRPLLSTFRKNRERLPDENSPGWDTTTFNSRYSKGKTKSRLTAVSTSSEENIVPHSAEAFSMEQPGIQVTREVTVTYQPSDVQFVHAAIVGLVQGEIANPKLVHR